MRKYIARVVVFGLIGTTAFAQIEQTHPELCGRDAATGLSVPPMSISVDRAQGTATLSLFAKRGEKRIGLPGVVDAVSEVCPAPGGRYVVFGETSNSTNLLIVDPSKDSVEDQFYGFDPVMSPDQRWIVYRKFYPRHHDASISEEYLVYDLSKTRGQNRLPGIDESNWADVGRVIFPVGRTNARYDAMDLPDDRAHYAGSVSFTWSSDSRVVGFGDLLQKHFAVIVVTMNQDGSTKAFEHAVAVSDVCSTKLTQGEFGLMMSGSQITQGPGGGYLIEAQFQPMPGVCEPKHLELRFPDDFHISSPEQPYEHHNNRKPAVVDP